MAKSNPFPRSAFNFVPYHDAGMAGLRRDLECMGDRELLDQYAVLAMLPDHLRDLSATRLALVRDILLTRLAERAA